MFSLRFLLFLFGMLTALTSGANAQGFDRSGLLTGRYFFRYVQLTSVTATGGAGRARSMMGTITFDGKGAYTASAVIADTVSGGTNGVPAVLAGVYRLQENGIGNISIQAEAAVNLDLHVGASALIGARIGLTSYGILVAIPAPTGSTAPQLTGNYSGGILEFQDGLPANARSATLKWSASTQGAFSSIAASGTALNLSPGVINQSIASAAYTMNATGAGTVQFGTPAGSAAQSLISGTKTIYASPDGELILGGSENGYDLLMAVRPAAGSSRTTLEDSYFTADLLLDIESLAPQKYFSGFLGSSRYNRAGTARHRFYHERNANPFDFTLTGDPLVFESDGAIDDGKDGAFFLSRSGAVTLFFGRTSPEFFIGVRFRDFPATGQVFLHPTGILNAGSYMPITAPISPGELINLYGSGFASSTTVAAALPFPTTLANVSVSIGGLRAPIYYVSPNAISVIVPFGLDLTQAAVPVIVTVNGTASNTVHVVTNSESPGVFTLSQNGLGGGAVLHADYSVVNAAKPAKPGETVLLFLTGLGTVTPKVADGAAGPASPLARADSKPVVRINGEDVSVSYSGLAPGLAGLYQVNFQIPSTTANGTYDLEIATGAWLSMQGTVQVAR